MTAGPAARRVPPPAVPAYGGGSLADVMPAALCALGVGPQPPVDGVELPASRRLCLLLLDGLGWNALRAHPEHAPFLTTLVDAPHSRRISTVFPSTTPIALTSLGTGLPPGEHGITGFYLRVGDRTLNTLANPAEADLRALQPRPTGFETAAVAGVAVTRVGPAAFDGAGLTEAALRGGDYAGAESMGERVAATAAAARRGGSSLTYVYVGDLDSTGHRQGPGSEAWRQELRHLDRLVEQLAAELPTDTTLVVTSDHGMVDVPLDRRWDLAATPELASGVEAVSGDLRAVNLHAADGAREDVLAAWQEVLGADFWVADADEAVELGLYGPRVTAEVRPRLGDVLAVAVADSAVADSRLHPPAVRTLLGLHGALTDDERHVPLLVHRA